MHSIMAGNLQKLPKVASCFILSGSRQSSRCDRLVSQRPQEMTRGCCLVISGAQSVPARVRLTILAPGQKQQARQVKDCWIAAAQFLGQRRAFSVQ